MPRNAAATPSADAGAVTHGAAMSADAGAASLDAARRDKRRQWRNRRPAARRIDLTPEEAERREAERRAKQRNQRLYVQVTAAEKNEITARAKKSGNRPSTYTRLVLLSDLKAPAPDRAAEQAEHAVSYQLVKLGTNVNQMAHIANETRMLPELDELRALAAIIKAALARLHRL